MWVCDVWGDSTGPNVQSIPLLFLYPVLSNFPVFGVGPLWGPDCLLMLHINMLAEDIRLMQVKTNMGKIHPCCSLFPPLESLSALLEPSVHLGIAPSPYVSCHSLVPMSCSLQKMVSWSGEATPGHRRGWACKLWVWLVLLPGPYAPSQMFPFSETILIYNMETV